MTRFDDSDVAVFAYDYISVEVDLDEAAEILEDISGNDAADYEDEDVIRESPWEIKLNGLGGHVKDTGDYPKEIKDFWAKLSRNGAAAVRETAARGPLGLAAYIRLLGDRSLAVRQSVIRSPRALEFLSASKKGLKALDEAFLDADVRCLCAGKLKDLELSGKCVAAIRPLVEKFEFAHGMEGPEFKLRIPGKAPVTATGRDGIEQAISWMYGLLINDCFDGAELLEQFFDIGLTDPRNWVRCEFAGLAEARTASARGYAEDLSVRVRRSLGAMPRSFSTDEVECFLEEEQDMIGNLMDSLRDRDDWWLLEETLLASPDEDIRGEVLGRLNGRRRDEAKAKADATRQRRRQMRDRTLSPSSSTAGSSTESRAAQRLMFCRRSSSPTRRPNRIRTKSRQRSVVSPPRPPPRSRSTQNGRSSPVIPGPRSAGGPPRSSSTPPPTSPSSGTAPRR